MNCVHATIHPEVLRLAIGRVGSARRRETRDCRERPRKLRRNSGARLGARVPSLRFVSERPLASTSARFTAQSGPDTVGMVFALSPRVRTL